MKICFCGLGSIGVRHLKNVISIAKKKEISLTVHALRTSTRNIETSISSFLDKECRSYDELDSDYDAFFITNPTAIHYDTLQRVADKSACFFIEKPLFHTLDVDSSLLPFREDAISYVAAPLRYLKVVQKVKEILKEESVLSVRAMCSSYLPDWRPGVDYRTVYSAQRDAGGGVELDIIHEWDYLVYLFGIPQKTLKLSAKVSELEIDSNDVAVYIGLYAGKTVELHLDYFGKMSQRRLELITDERVIQVDLLKGTITFSDDTPALCFTEERNEKYIKEMETFFDIWEKKKKSENSLEHAYQVLSLALSETEE